MEEDPRLSPAGVLPSYTEELAQFVAEYQRVFGLAYKLGKLSNITEAEALADATMSLQTITEKLLDATPAEEGSLTGEAFEAAGMPAVEILDALDNSLAGAHLLDDLARDLSQEEQAQTEQATPLSDQLLAEQQGPTQTKHFVQDIRDEILIATGDILEQYASALLWLLWKEEETTKTYKVPPVTTDRTDARLAEDTAFQDSVETLLAVIRHRDFQGVPQVELGGSPAATSVARTVRIYRQWRGLQNNKLPADAPSSLIKTQPAPTPPAVLIESTEPTEATPYTSQPAAEVATLQAEIAQLIDLHVERSRWFRPSWSKLKPTFRGLDLALMQQSPATGEQDTEAFNQARRRLIGLMAVFAEQGADKAPNAWQVELQERLAIFFTFERAIDANLRKGQRALRAAKAVADINRWLPVEPDVALLYRYWSAMQPTAIEDWPASNREGAIISITTALRAFNAYRRELADPEQHLKTIAIRLGATALQPETRAASTAELSPTQRHQAAQGVLEEIINNERQHENTRRRAEILKYFLAVAGQAHHAGETPQLYYIPPNERQITPYFCVPLGANWMFIESLLYGKASYAFPQKLIAEHGGSLKKFLDTYNKVELVQKGGIKVTHAEGWTVASHIALIRQRVAAAEERGYMPIS